MMNAITYFCQNCNAQVKSSKLLYGSSCSTCSDGILDDWPADAVMGNPLEDEESLAYFDRYIAGDR
jgi:DNA-directed RNA polymerase subunit RPC12/RpoP